MNPKKVVIIWDEEHGTAFCDGRKKQLKCANIMFETLKLSQYMKDDFFKILHFLISLKLVQDGYVMYMYIVYVIT